MSVQVHPTAIVDPGAELGEGVEIGAYCVVEDKVRLGDGCKLAPFAQVKSYSELGPGNTVHSYALIGGEPQHLSFRGEETWVRIGAKNIIREYATVHRGTVGGGGETVIGSGCMIMAYVHVAHDCKLGNGVIMANCASLAGHVTIGDRAIISGMSGVHQFARIGEYAFLGAMGGFGQDVPPYTIATGVRANLHGINKIGLKRAGFSRDTITALKRSYQLIFRTPELIREQALEECLQSYPEIPEVAKLVEFVSSSERGVTPDSGGKANGLNNL